MPPSPSKPPSKPVDEAAPFGPAKAARELKKLWRPLSFRKCANCGTGGLLRALYADYKPQVWCWTCGAQDDQALGSAYDPVLTELERVKLEVIEKLLRSMGEIA